MNREVYKMLKAADVHKPFMIMLLLRSPFDILNSVIMANMIHSFLHIIENGYKDLLLKNVLLYLLLIVLLFGYNMTVWSTIAVKTSVLMQKNLRKLVFKKIMGLSPSELENTFGADWFTRLNNDVDKACGYLTSPVNYMHMIIALVNLVISSVIMLFLSVELYVIGIFWLTAAFLINTLIISRKISEYKKSAQKNLVEYTDWIDITLKDKKILSVFDGEDFIQSKISQKSIGIFKDNMRVHNKMSLCNMCYAYSGMLGYLMILIRGNDIMGDAITDLGDLFKMTQYRSGTVASVNIIYNSVNNMKGALVGVNRVNEIIFAERK